MNASPGLIFDLDGTLLDTLESLASAYNQMLTELGYPTLPIDDYRQVIGDGVRTAVVRALPADVKDEAVIAQGMLRFKEIYQGRWHEAAPYHGIEELLANLKGSYPLAVLSNKDDAFTQQCIDHYFPGLFDSVVGFRPGLKHKPDPAGGRLVAKELGLAPEDCWMIGDTRTDMETAVACNMTGVGVLWGFRDENELRTHGATRIIAAPRDLTLLLSGTAS